MGFVAAAALSLLLLTGCGSAVAQAFDREPDAGNAGPAETSLMALLPQMENYDNPDGPLFTEQLVDAPDEVPTDLVVVSYNLRYGDEIEAAIAAYRQENPLPEADIVLLQEMDEDDVSRIARGLGYNYVYYPASVAEDGDNFGNAILSRWPISDPAKLILPGLHPLSGQQRTATRAVVHVGDADILTYSTHIEVAASPGSLRREQFAAILDDIPDDATHVIVGGDFNTATSWGVDSLAEQFAAADMEHSTAGVGPTFTRFGLRPSATDHIFARGFETVDAGVLIEVTASDHFPVWARLAQK